MRNGRSSTSGSTRRLSPRKRAYPEDAIQRQLFTWITLATPRIPQLALAFAVPNGGFRTKIESARLKGLGVRAGVPDILIPGVVYKPHPEAEDECITYTGLAIELKAGKNKPTDVQLDWHERLRGVGWFVCVCYSFDEARQVICDYFGCKA